MSEPRSYLYVPGDRPDLLEKATRSDADAVIIDLEDAVAPAAKDHAREQVRQWLAERNHPEMQVWVRMNTGAPGGLDLAVLAGSAHITGFCLAKTDSIEDVERAARLLDQQGSSAELMPLLESARAILAAESIAVGPRVSVLQIGEVDLAADVGITPSPSGVEFSWSRSRVVFASAAAGIRAPMAPVSTDFRDTDLFTSTTAELGRMGFFGRACIHPNQVAVSNALFTVSAADAARAQELVALESQYGGGAFTGPDGRMVDEAVLRAARRTIARFAE